MTVIDIRRREVAALMGTVLGNVTLAWVVQIENQMIREIGENLLCVVDLTVFSSSFCSPLMC